jgi:tryptophanyl-tRNA synthetase
MSRVLSGLQPSGDLHLGNYLGAIRNWVADQDVHDAYYCIVDLHALTLDIDPAELRSRTFETALDLLASGLDPERCTLFVQSHVPEHTQMTWLLECTATMGELRRMTQFKDKSLGKDSVRASLFTYPVLQAADILAVDADLVPVGKDQVQHVEITRDLAEHFNNAFQSEVFKLPAYRLAECAGVLPGIDGEKMSKSYGNEIDPFQDEKPLRKRIMSIKTDSLGVDDPKDPEASIVFQIYRAIAGKDDPRTLALADRFRAPGMGYGHAKQALFELILEHFGPARARHAELVAKPEYVDDVLKKGAAVARERARATIGRARRAVGLD